MVMKSILQQLCTGELNPTECCFCAEDAHAEQYRQIQRKQALLLQDLDESVRTELRLCLEKQEELYSIELEAAFIRGMRMGARLAVDLLGDEVTSPQPDTSA